MHRPRGSRRDDEAASQADATGLALTAPVRYSVAMLVEQMKAQLKEAMKAKDLVAKDVLRTALGEVQTAESRATEALSDAEVQKILKKLVKSNTETLGVTKDPATKDKLTRENEILAGLLPKSLSVDEIVAALAAVTDAIKAAKADGPAMGVAMKTLKQSGAAVEAPDVNAAVRKIRAG